MADHTLSYFRKLWHKSMLDLQSYCEEWEKICSNSPIPDDVHGEIRTAIGLARLLMNQKLKQFNGLIDDSEFNTGEKEITCSDLEGFWDMVYYEVEKIQKSFERLNKCKINDWKFVEEISEKHIKKVPIKKDISAINKKKEISKAQMLAARQRIAEVRKKMAAERRQEKDQNQVDILLPNKQGFVENNANYESVINPAVLNDKVMIKEANEKRKSNHEVSSKTNMPVETKDLLKGTLDLTSASKQKSVQKKRYITSNKENVFLDKDSSDLKRTPTKQAKFSEPAIQELKNAENKKDFVKLQCVTRSAAKKALLLQQNSLQK